MTESDHKSVPVFPVLKGTADIITILIFDQGFTVAFDSLPFGDAKRMSCFFVFIPTRAILFTHLSPELAEGCGSTPRHLKMLMSGLKLFQRKFSTSMMSLPIWSPCG